MPKNNGGLMTAITVVQNFPERTGKNMLEKLNDLKNQIGKSRRFGNTCRNKLFDE